MNNKWIFILFVAGLLLALTTNSWSKRFRIPAYSVPEGSHTQEEGAGQVIVGDVIIRGELKEFSKASVTVGDSTYQICPSARVANQRNQYVNFNSLDTAERVEIFWNNRKQCVRKIKILESSK